MVELEQIGDCRENTSRWRYLSGSRRVLSGQNLRENTISGSLEDLKENRGIKGINWKSLLLSIGVAVTEYNEQSYGRS